MIAIIRINLKHKIMVLLWGIAIIQSSLAEDVFSAPVAVVYPEMEEPYRSVFADIVTGIDDGLSNPLLHFALQKDVDHNLNTWLKKNNCSTVVALGKQGLNATSNLNVTTNLNATKYAIIAGAILSPPTESDEKLIGITLSPSPEKLFFHLTQLSPKVKRIHLIYSDKNSAWLIPYVEQAAKKHKLILNALKANGLAEAATLYRDLMESNISNEDAIWLPHDNVTVDHRTILPMLLKEAWDKQFIVFSSNPAYVRRGVLFALFPDNIKMGTSLAHVVTSLMTQSNISTSGLLPLEELKIAVNIRTADHLGLDISSSQRRSFDLVFPAPR